MLRYRMDRAHWETIHRDDIEIHGLAAALPMFGLEPSAEPGSAE
jgi:hypothetical protein